MNRCTLIILLCFQLFFVTGCATFIADTITMPLQLLILRPPYANTIAEAQISMAENRIKKGALIFQKGDPAEIQAYIHSQKNWQINWFSKNLIMPSVQYEQERTIKDYAQFLNTIDRYQQFETLTEKVLQTQSPADIRELVEFANRSGKNSKNTFKIILESQPLLDLIKPIYKKQEYQNPSFTFLSALAAQCQKEEFNALQDNNREGYVQFLNKYPNGSYSNLANVKIDLFDCNEAIRLNTYDSHTLYLEKHPQGQCASELDGKLDSLLCAHVVKKDLFEGYKAYLDKYPNGTCRTQVKQKISPLVWKEIVKRDSPEMYRFYLQHFPEGKRVAQAKKQLAIFRLIDQLQSKDLTTVKNTVDKLSTMSNQLSKGHITHLEQLLSTGKESWNSFLYKQSHCQWFEKVTTKYFAGQLLTTLTSPHISAKTRNSAQKQMASGKTKFKKTDPGWI